MSEEDTKKFADVSKKYGECMMKAMGATATRHAAGTPTRLPPRQRRPIRPPRLRQATSRLIRPPRLRRATSRLIRRRLRRLQEARREEVTCQTRSGAQRT